MNMLPNVLIEDLCYNFVKAGKTAVLTRCLCEKLWARTKGKKGIVAGKTKWKTESRAHSISFPWEIGWWAPRCQFFTLFPEFLRERRMGILLTLCRRQRHFLVSWKLKTYRILNFEEKLTVRPTVSTFSSLFSWFQIGPKQKKRAGSVGQSIRAPRIGSVWQF